MKGYPRAWNEQAIIGISQFLTNSNSSRPSDLHRCIPNRIRPLDTIHHWKATECRTFLLYVGIVALYGRLNAEEYKMFLNLFCAVTICSSNFYRNFLPLARRLFVDFIEDNIAIYGQRSVTMNIHNTCHVVDDVEMFGSLDTISAYPFENHLHHLKRKLKQCNKPLQQIARRIIESKQNSKVMHSNDDTNFPILKNPFTFDDSDTLCFRYIEYKPNAFLSSRNQNMKDKWFLTFDNQIIEFCHIARNVRNENVITGSEIKNARNFFDYPVQSSYLNIFLTDTEKAEQKQYKLSSIKAKMFSLRLNDSEFVFVPLLHTL